MIYLAPFVLIAPLFVLFLIGRLWVRGEGQ